MLCILHLTHTGNGLGQAKNTHHEAIDNNNSNAASRVKSYLLHVTLHVLYIGDYIVKKYDELMTLNGLFHSYILH